MCLSLPPFLCTYVGIFELKVMEFSSLEEDADIDDDPVMDQGEFIASNPHLHVYCKLQNDTVESKAQLLEAEDNSLVPRPRPAVRHMQLGRGLGTRLERQLSYLFSTILRY